MRQNLDVPIGGGVDRRRDSTLRLRRPEMGWDISSLTESERRYDRQKFRVSSLDPAAHKDTDSPNLLSTLDVPFTRPFVILKLRIYRGMCLLVDDGGCTCTMKKRQIPQKIAPQPPC